MPGKLRVNSCSPVFVAILLFLALVMIFVTVDPATGVAQEFVPGDVTGDGIVNVRDVVAVMQYVLALRSLNEEELIAADVNADGRIDVRDVTMLMRYSLGLIDCFNESFSLGSEVLLSEERHLVEGRRVGLVTNQSGVNSRGQSTKELFFAAEDIDLKALYAPEHGLDGRAAAGEYVKSYTHEDYNIPVHSLYGATRMPTEEMLKGIEVLVYDIQDIGARSYTFISTLNYCMQAAQEYGVLVVVLDRPNPLGGILVDGPMMEEKFRSFVGVDILPKAHGMTVGELARYFNRDIGVELTVVPMQGYYREMIYQDTGLSWVQTSPNMPDLEAVFGYMATGLGEGTGLFQADQFRWVGGMGLDAEAYAARLNAAGLEGVEFVPEEKNEAGGVRLKITDYHSFNPARTGIYVLSCAFELGNFTIPRSNDVIVMFDRIIGTDKMGLYLEERLSPKEIEERFAPGIEEFKAKREQYLISRY